MLIFTLSIYFFMPILALPFVVMGAYLDTKKRNIYIILLALIMAVIGFHFTPPNSEYDLYRYNMLMDQMKNEGIYYVKNISEYKFFFVTNYLFYLVALTNVFELLPAITAFIVYYILFYIITDYSYRNNISNNKYILTMIFMVMYIPAVPIFGGIRNALAYAIIILAIYRDMVISKKNLKTYFLYIIPLFIHSAVMPIYIFRILLCINSKFIKGILNVLILCWPLYLVLIKIILEKLTFIPPLAILNNKIIDYTARNYISSDHRTVILFTILICIFILVKSIFYKFYGAKNNKYNIDDYNRLTNSIVFFSLGAIAFKYSDIFFRYTTFMFYLTPVLMLSILNIRAKVKWSYYKVICIIGLVLIGFISAIYQYRNLSQINFDMVKILFFNLFTMFQKLL